MWVLEELSYSAPQNCQTSPHIAPLPPRKYPLKRGQQADPSLHKDVVPYDVGVHAATLLHNAAPVTHHCADLVKSSRLCALFSAHQRQNSPRAFLAYTDSTRPIHAITASTHDKQIHRGVGYEPRTTSPCDALPASQSTAPALE